MENQELLDTVGEVLIYYTNYRGEVGWKHIIPQKIKRTVSSHKYHPNKWILDGIDLKKMEPRSYCITDIHTWLERDHPQFAVVAKEEGFEV